MSRRKQLWILAGGNGAGKSPFYSHFLEPLGLPFVNADLLAKMADPDAPEAHSYDAARIAEQMRNELLLSGASFCFETVYSHPSKIDFVAQTKGLGYEVIRVGGHSVPEEKVSRRIPQTLQHIKIFIPLCDRLIGLRLKKTPLFRRYPLSRTGLKNDFPTANPTAVRPPAINGKR